MKIEENLAPIVEGSLVVGEEERVIGKVVDTYSGTIVGGAMSEMNGDNVAMGGNGGGREGGELDDGGGGKVTHVWGWTKCIVLKDDMGLEDVQRKGNDEHGYLYVGESDGPKRHTEKATLTCDDDTVRGRSGRGRDDMVKKGRKGAGVKRAAVSGSRGCIDDHPQTRLRVGGKIIEMSDDYEISVTLEDVGKDEAAAKGGEESSKGKLEMDKHKQDMIKWNNGVGERTEHNLADSYQKMGCIAAVECYSLMLEEYNVELTNSRKLVVYDYVHLIYKTATQQIIYNQLAHPMEMHDMGTFDAKTGRVVGRDELDDDYDHCPPPMGDSLVGHRQSAGSHKRRAQGLRGAPNARTYRNPRAEFDANYEGDIVEVEDLLDGSCIPGLLNHIRCPQLTDSFALCSYWVVSYEHTPTPVCVLMSEYSVACSPVSGNLKCLPGRRQMFTVINHGLQPGKPMVCKWCTHEKLTDCLLSCQQPPTPVCMVMCKFSGACGWGPANVACSPGRRQMLTMVKHGVQAVNSWGSDKHSHS
ncbi:LOW QUALITY PROTEIN: hypothetical protein Cgig2_008548 [Carnegiea gigantea]|uniref:Uncharacterized protein n=1 Tax=Carnegiea gigantea TaxID=171969 RepID=A0A9Q1JXM8_9CARY|nr:LOW QUALITY PROTEIN: hypothetical protein Cgig2_008548 [Carnegiea gigantea]